MVLSLLVYLLQFILGAVGLLSKESTIWVIESTIKKSQNRSKIVDSLDFLSKQFLKKVLDLSKQFFWIFLTHLWQSNE